MSMPSQQSSSSSSSSSSSHLTSLLSKLRPFQRTAFEFAVHGTISTTLSSSHDDDVDDDVDDDDADESGKSVNRKTRGNEKAARGIPIKSAKAKAVKSVNKRSGGKRRRSSTKQHETTGVAGAGTGRILLGDEMGLGKTLTSLAIMLAYQQTEWPLLILCPASLRYTWPTEIEKWCPWIPSQSIHVVRGADDVHFAAQIQKWRNQKHQNEKAAESQLTSPEDNNNTIAKKKKCPIQIVIVTYSLLQNRFQIANTLRDCEFQCIIADESHNLKQLTSQRCQLALPLLQSSKRLLLLSGTPALNRPVELWPQLHALDAKGKMFGNGGDNNNGMRYGEYTKRYCNARRTRFGYDVKGVSNADELHVRLKSVMMRRLKCDVLKDLPSKQRAIVPVGIADKGKEREGRETMARLGDARRAVSEITEMDGDDVANSAQWESRKLLMQAYQASGVAKAPATTEYILDWLEGSDSTQKLVVFAHHKEVLDYIETTVSKKYKGRLGMMRIDGSVPPAERAIRVKKFQSNKKIRLSLLSMTAAGVGLTLTAASNIIFAELHWTPGVLAQAEDRCHRIGQANSVNVMYCICKDEEVSVDMSLWSMLGRKLGNLGRVVDGERGKGLNAVERNIEASPNNGGEKKSVSVEEELSSFFASSNFSSAGKPSKGPVVKGTIQSFFRKQTKKSESSAKESALVEKDHAPKSKGNYISLLDDEQAKKNPSAAKKPFLVDKENTRKSKVACISLLDDGDGIENITRKRARLETVSKTTSFICHVCTFENLTGSAACTMCGTPASGTTTSSANVPVESKSAPSTQEWSCSVCTYVNSNNTTRCDMCREERQPENAENEDTVRKSSHVDGDRSTNSICKGIRFRENDECIEGDLAAVDVTTRCHSQLSQPVSQSPSPPTQSPVNSQKDCMSRECTVKNTSCQPGTTNILSFSVSRNSGRIALHLSSSGQPLHINFDISATLTKSCADRLDDINLSRKAPDSTFSQLEQEISFDDGAVRHVLAPLCDDTAIPVTMSIRDSMQLMCKELKQFVRCYLSLREVEKKSVKESGEAIAPSSLKQTVAKLLVSTVTGTTERYLGGAKERAILNMKNNCATAEDKAVINGQACAWCAKAFLCSNGATYCSQSCVEEGRLRRGGIYASSKIRQQVFALEHGICTKCGINAHELFCKMKALHPAERLNALLNAKWKLPQTRQGTDRLLNDPKESDFWQADHEIAVAEGGGSTGLDNLRTLCTPCHSVETEKLFARLKTMPDSQIDKHAKDGLTQMDIMSCFSQMKGDKSSGTKKRRKRRRVAD